MNLFAKAALQKTKKLRKISGVFKPQEIDDTTQSAVLPNVRNMFIHLRLILLLSVRRTQTCAACMVWPIAKHGIILFGRVDILRL